MQKFCKRYRETQPNPADWSNTFRPQHVKWSIARLLELRILPLSTQSALATKLLQIQEAEIESSVSLPETEQRFE